jgi:hypothetical protein
MVKVNYKQRAEDKLNLNSRILGFVDALKESCKTRPSILHAVTAQLSRMHNVRIKLEKQLLEAKSTLAFKGIWHYMKSLSAINDLKGQLTKINEEIVSWMNIVSNHLVPKVLSRAASQNGL